MTMPHPNLPVIIKRLADKQFFDKMKKILDAPFMGITHKERELLLSQGKHAKKKESKPAKKKEISHKTRFDLLDI